MTYRLIPRLALTCSLAALFLLATNPFAAGADNPPVMRLDPSSQSVDVGNGPFTVSVMIDNVSGLGSYEFELQFDPSVVRFVGVEDGGFLGSTQRQVVIPCQSTLFYSNEGEPPYMIRYGCDTLNLTPAGPDGSGRLAVVTLAPVAPGHSNLTLIKSNWFTGTSDVLGADLNNDFQSGGVTITGAGPTATPADEPTSVPTAKYVTPVPVTPDPGAYTIFTPEPGATPLTRPMPGGPQDFSHSGALQAASDPAAIARGASGSASGSNHGSPHAGTGPEQQRSSWPALAGGLLVAAGAGLLLMSFYLKRVPSQRNTTSKK